MGVLTPNLGLEEPFIDNESERNLWGQKLNNNFTILDTKSGENDVKFAAQTLINTTLQNKILLMAIVLG